MNMQMQTPMTEMLAGEARLNITWEGHNGDFVEPVRFDASDREIREIARAALAAGDVPGVPALRRRQGRQVDLSTFVIDRFPASRAVPYARIFVRPLTPFG